MWARGKRTADVDRACQQRDVAKDLIAFACSHARTPLPQSHIRVAPRTSPGRVGDKANNLTGVSSRARGAAFGV